MLKKCKCMNKYPDFHFWVDLVCSSVPSELHTVDIVHAQMLIMERIICHWNRLMWVNALWYINPSLSPAVPVKRCHLWCLYLLVPAASAVRSSGVRRVAGSISTLLISSLTADR